MRDLKSVILGKFNCAHINHDKLLSLGRSTDNGIA